MLAGELRVHSHCYRSDEILMLMRVADRFGVKVKSLQHALEGYKVAPESDDNEMMRHLNQEAAKLVKYCAFTDEKALHAITLNPAKQLGIDERVGTIEVGKDGDLAIFTGHPLNSFSRCEMTLVEGEVYFQAGEKLVPVPAARATPVGRAATFPAIPEMRKGIYVLSGGTVHSPTLAMRTKPLRSRSRAMRKWSIARGGISIPA